MIVCPVTHTAHPSNYAHMENAHGEEGSRRSKGGVVEKTQSNVHPNSPGHRESGVSFPRATLLNSRVWEVDQISVIHFPDRKVRCFCWSEGKHVCVSEG